MGKRSHYDVLGVARSAESKEIKAAYLRAVKTSHPDKGGSAEAFQEVQAAFAVLSSATRRKEYDESGETFDHEAYDDAEDEGYREHRQKQAEWERRTKARQKSWKPGRGSRTGYGYGSSGSKEEWFAEHGFTMPGENEDRSWMYDVDAWEMGHQLGRWGRGSEADLRLRDYYARMLANEERAKQERDQKNETRDQAYFRRRGDRMRERDRQRMQSIKEQERAAAEARKRKFHSAARGGQSSMRSLAGSSTVVMRSAVANGLRVALRAAAVR